MKVRKRGERGSRHLSLSFLSLGKRDFARSADAKARARQPNAHRGKYFTSLLVTRRSVKLSSSKSLGFLEVEYDPLKQGFLLSVLDVLEVVGRLVRDLLEDLLGSSQNPQFLGLCIYPCCSASIEDDVDWITE